MGGRWVRRHRRRDRFWEQHEIVHDKVTKPRTCLNHMSTYIAMGFGCFFFTPTFCVDLFLIQIETRKLTTLRK